MDNGASSYRRFLDGDKAAFEEIVNELFRPLVFFILGYVGNVHDAEDVAIDAFSDLIVNPRRYNFKTSLKTYLFMIGKSRAVDLLRHRKVAVTADLSE
ncbi:MAG: RNA polymerase subunit sigma-24, partial [Clostridia bacterium]|nr:RNA polymerase subunit sigma-24 [Clostridia bacterium]